MKNIFSFCAEFQQVTCSINPRRHFYAKFIAKPDSGTIKATNILTDADNDAKLRLAARDSTWETHAYLDEKKTTDLKQEELI